MSGRKHCFVRGLLGLLLVLAAGKAQAGEGVSRLGVQLGPRPFYLLDEMVDSSLKRELQQCAGGPFKVTDFSIAHRGAPLQFPEHTRESYVAGARMGAGILECDVTFTADGELVCRHSECDLHSTTNILATSLASKCSTPFSPATRDVRASAKCCASDITLAEFKTLCGLMDGSEPRATTVEEFLGGTADYRTDLYATCGTVLSHKESIELFDGLGRKFTPELKAGDPARIAAVFGTQERYAQKMLDDYKDADIDPARVFPQSFNLADVQYWIKEEPQFGRQAVYLISSTRTGPLTGSPGVIHDNPPPLAEFLKVKKLGVKIVAPPMAMLLSVDGRKIVASAWARSAKAAGFDLIAWTVERSGRINEDVKARNQRFYYQTTLSALQNDGDIYTTIDILAQDVGIRGLFSDWPATTTYYANCKKPGAP